MNTPAEQGFDIMMCLGKLLSFIHIGLNAGEFVEIGADILRSLPPGDRQLTGKPEGRNPINYPKINRLCPPSRLRIHLRKRHAKHL